MMIKKGYKVSRNGAPEYFLQAPDGTLLGVNVKHASRSRFRQEKRAIGGLLVKHGIPVFDWGEDDGFREVGKRERPVYQDLPNLRRKR